MVDTVEEAGRSSLYRFSHATEMWKTARAYLRLCNLGRLCGPFVFFCFYISEAATLTLQNTYMAQMGHCDNRGSGATIKLNRYRIAPTWVATLPKTLLPPVFVVFNLAAPFRREREMVKREKQDGRRGSVARTPLWKEFELRENKNLSNIICTVFAVNDCCLFITKTLRTPHSTKSFNRRISRLGKPDLHELKGHIS